MKGLSRKKFSQVGRRLGDWFSAASHSSMTERLNYRCHASFRSIQLTGDPLNSRYLGSQSTQHSRSYSMLITTPLIDRLFVAFV